MNYLRALSNQGNLPEELLYTPDPITEVLGKIPSASTDSLTSLYKTLLAIRRDRKISLHK